MNSLKSETDQWPIVAAIDFGTTYSSCAYSFRHTDTLQINMNEKWSGGVDATSVPTSVFLDNDKKFVAFGKEAENIYEQKSLHKEHLNWHLFRRFKMTLHNNEDLGLNTEIEDENGVRMRAVTIFGMAIKDIKTQLLATLKRNGHDTTDEHILWVLTVPAIWTEAAKQFMQEAADMAEIPRERLKLALEPEAAAIFCKELTTHKRTQKKTGDEDISLMKAFDPGSQYLVLDLGGGTVDITIQEVLRPNANLKILDKATGGVWGGVSVDNYFLKFLKKLIGFDLYDKFSREFPYQKFKLEKAIEACKREATPETSKGLLITVPSELKDLYEKTTGRKFDSDIANQTQFKGDISIIGSEMEIKAERIHSFYETTMDNIITHVHEVLKTETAKGVSYMLLVGGFAESPLVEAKIKKAFEGKRIKRVIVPREAGNAVVKGAVIFGHKPNAIAERVSPYTYGVETVRKSNPEKHPGNRRITANGVVYDKVACVFDKRELGFRMTCQGTVLEAEASDKSSGKKLTAKFNFFHEE